VSKNKKYFQLMTFLEEQNINGLGQNSIPQTYASIDYTERFPYIYGTSLGILTDTNNTPIQEITSIKTN